MICENCGTPTENKVWIRALGESFHVCQTACEAAMLNRWAYPVTGMMDAAKEYRVEISRIVEFVDWMKVAKEQIFSDYQGVHVPVREIEAHVMEFYGISPEGLESERRAVVEHIQKIRERPNPNRCHHQGCYEDHLESSVHCVKHRDAQVLA